MGPAFLELAEHLFSDGKWWINSLICFAFVQAFALPIQLPLAQLTSSLTFTLPVFPLRGVGWGVEGARGWVVLTCLPELNHDAKEI